MSVIGRLGIPLGRTAKIECTIFDGTSLNIKGYDGVYLLKVSSVNGHPLDEEPLLEFHLAPGSHVKLANGDFELYKLKFGESTGSLTGEQIKDLKKGYVGRALTLEVYELGRFSGLPSNLPPESYGMLWADRGFHFRTYLRVLSEINEKDEKK